jgi:hypothetical protein
MVSASKFSPVSSRVHSLGDDRRRLRQAPRLSLRAIHSAGKPDLPTTTVGDLRASPGRSRSRRSIILDLRIRSASLLAALILLGTSAPAALATDCVGQPGLQAAQDGHWRYWIDRPSHRKCWYLQRQSPSAGSSTSEPKPADAGATSFPSVFSSLVTAWQSAVSIRPQPDAPTADAPTPSADQIAPKRSASASRGRHGAWHEKRAARLVQLRQPQWEHADQHQQLDPAQRDALFEEFLHWSVRQEHAPSLQGRRCGNEPALGC